MNNTSITTSFKFNIALLFLVNAFFAFAGTILNSVVIMSLWNSQLRRKLCYFMIFILACFDLPVVVVFHTIIILEIFLRDYTEAWFIYIVQLLPFSPIAYLLMTLERYLALVHPFFHERSITKSRLMAAFVLFQLPFAALPIGELKLSSDVIFPISNALFVVIVLSICTLNFKLFYFAKTIRKRANVILGNLDGSNSEQRNVERKKFKVTFSILKKISTCLLAVLCLFICHVPAIVNIGLDMRQTHLREENTFILNLWVVTFIALNSSLNCLIFFYQNSVLRRHGQMFLKNIFAVD